LTSASAYNEGIYKSDLVRRMSRWMEATPHPQVAIEICPERVAGARFARTGSLHGFAIENLPAGALVPSAVETNMGNAAAVKSAVSNVCTRLGAKEEDVALLLPDPVIRVFVQHFDDFPRTSEEAIPMLRWKLKKSVPFEVDETLLSYMRQAPRVDGVDVVTAIARLRIIREYEGLVEQAALHPGVVLSIALAAISILEDQRPTLLARVSGTALTTAIVRQGVLAGYRCTELPTHAGSVTPQMLLEEIFPLAAYYRTRGRKGFRRCAWRGCGGVCRSLCGRWKKSSSATWGRC
jgi:type IV pilus assembly protein PilM